MKFQLKALAAALALVAAVPAQAAIDGSSTGNSSFVLTVWDAAANISASFDLGKNYSDFSVAPTASFANSGVTNAGTAFAWDFTGGDYATAWSNFAAAANESNASWAITAADNLGAGAGSRGMITTYTGAPFAPLNSNGLVTTVGNFNTFTNALATVDSTYQNHSSVLNGASTAVPGTPAYYLPYYTNGRNNNVGPISAGLINTSLGVVQTLAAASGAAQVSNTVFGNGAAFTLTSAGQLTYLTTPVPEADTWAMMLLGLGFMGFVARRKQA